MFNKRPFFRHPLGCSNDVQSLAMCCVGGSALELRNLSSSVPVPGFSTKSPVPFRSVLLVNFKLPVPFQFRSGTFQFQFQKSAILCLETERIGSKYSERLYHRSSHDAVMQ